MVLGDALQRRADEPHATRIEVGQPAEIIEDLEACGVRVQRVDGEVAPRRVRPPVIGECHFGVPPVGRDVAPQGGHFDGDARRDDGHRAMRDARRHRLQPRPPRRAA